MDIYGKLICRRIPFLSRHNENATLTNNTSRLMRAGAKNAHHFNNKLIR